MLLPLFGNFWDQNVLIQYGYFLLLNVVWRNIRCGICVHILILIVFVKNPFVNGGVCCECWFSACEPYNNIIGSTHNAHVKAIINCLYIFVTSLEMQTRLQHLCGKSPECSNPFQSSLHRQCGSLMLRAWFYHRQEQYAHDCFVDSDNNSYRIIELVFYWFCLHLLKMLLSLCCYCFRLLLPPLIGGFFRVDDILVSIVYNEWLWLFIVWWRSLWSVFI